MKLRLLMAVASAVLFLAPRTVSAQEIQGQQGAGVSGHMMMQQNANESAQATTDMPFSESGQGMTPGAQPVRSVSYGGVAAGQSDAGGRQNQPCTSAGPLCRIYFGQ
ncbi:hypothetical protein BCh11DRAFT_02241 [Burkholderia sp. Ch1-1]|uniref:Uncharacterized protein n=1 Tax=Paraburkholderia dioscoreae TaxID=2604047 RepID=A0A5Q4ZQR0_9BURK|nr:MULTISPECIES: hypothetical protein [Paraburkholderia]EIF34439.1 hypothetical protein BCh11DRAFT_02241 [Burkholderia sp. Ch1-1]MDR8395305.1 hypothetical protein [Paraburkholderia sp. USG1]VVD33378.1 conserved exported protein of unknown function [Paraburkholderia dioscoreae]